MFLLDFNFCLGLCPGCAPQVFVIAHFAQKVTIVRECGLRAWRTCCNLQADPATTADRGQFRRRASVLRVSLWTLD